MSDLANLCASHGIAPRYTGIDGREHDVRESTLAALAEIFELQAARATPPDGIAAALAEPAPRRCHIPAELREGRAWGITCQLPSLRSARNFGIGDFADLAALCGVAAAAGADFVGINPLHALFGSEPQRISPFFPSNRRFLNPIYIAPDWIDGFSGLSEAERTEIAVLLQEPRLVDFAGSAGLKDRLLRQTFTAFAWDDASRADFTAFCQIGGDALAAHALFEVLSEKMVADGFGAGWMTWPEPFHNYRSDAVRRFAEENADRVAYHLWLQWIADRQLARVQRMACDVGMRIGLYIDMAVGAAPDGSASWTDPHLTVPGVAVGAPPDDFFQNGQDWGLAPLSPIQLAELDGAPFVETVAAALRHAGMIRLDHAMSIARLWLIPRGAAAIEGAYVTYPLSILLRRLAEVTEAAGAIVVGEDLGVVPEGFRELMADRNLHSCRAFLLQQHALDFRDAGPWPVAALASVATHDMATFAGWWNEADLNLRRDLGHISEDQRELESARRAKDRDRLQTALGATNDAADVSVRLYRALAMTPCRLLALQLEDALGVTDQINVPGTVDEYPNWRHCLPVAVDALADNPLFRAHAEAIAGERPR